MTLWQNTLVHRCLLVGMLIQVPRDGADSMGIVHMVGDVCCVRDKSAEGADIGWD